MGGFCIIFDFNMPVDSPDLSIALTLTDGCGTITLTDNTGIYPTADAGYGLPNGPAVNDVDSLTVTVTGLKTAVSFVYAFTISSGTITAATLALAGATAVNILSQLDSTTFPLNDFDLFGTYGVTLPSLDDDVYMVTYQIEGTADAEDFDFTVQAAQIVTCQTQCCIDKKFIDLDLSCGCSAGPLKEVEYLQALLTQAIKNVDYEFYQEGADKLAEAKSKCDTAGCGC